MPELEASDNEPHEYDHEEPQAEPDAIPLGLATQEVVDLLEQFATAITKGDGDAAAELFDVPTFIIGDNVEFMTHDLDEIAAFMGKGKAEYNKRGVVGTNVDIIHLHFMGDRLALVEVRWPWIDERGEEIGAESSTYTLRRDDDGHFKIRMALMHGREHEAH